MIRTSLVLGAAALCLAPMATAQNYGYGCEQQRNQDRLLGGVAGAVVGGALGAAITDNDDDHYYHRGRRGYRGYHGYSYHHDNNDDQIVGAIVGGVIGAALGSELAGSSTNCNQYNYSDAYAPTRSPYGPAWQTSGADPNYGNVTYQRPPQTYPSYSYPQQQAYPDYSYAQPQAQQDECTTVRREVRFPDGSVQTEPVDVCRDQNGRWVLEDDLYGGY